MTQHARRAFPVWAVPAMVALLAAPLAVHASEGGAALPLTIAPATAAAAPVVAPPPPAIQAPAQPAPTHAPATHALATHALATHAVARSTVPPPRPIAAGPVWTDASGTWRQAGIASWYGGRRWQGRLTASGVRFDERQLTAAHASLPIGSRVRVTVADTGRSVIVTINDRPGTRKRIIDLSRAAAEELGILRHGIARVTLTPS